MSEYFGNRIRQKNTVSRCPFASQVDVIAKFVFEHDLGTMVHVEHERRKNNDVTPRRMDPNLAERRNLSARIPPPSEGPHMCQVRGKWAYAPHSGAP